jgi:hypothetical protein
VFGFGKAHKRGIAPDLFYVLELLDNTGLLLFLWRFPSFIQFLMLSFLRDCCRARLWVWAGLLFVVIKRDIKKKE